MTIYATVAILLARVLYWIVHPPLLPIEEKMSHITPEVAGQSFAEF